MNSTELGREALRNHLISNPLTITIDFDKEYGAYFAAVGGPDSENYTSGVTIEQAVTNLIAKVSDDLALECLHSYVLYEN